MSENSRRAAAPTSLVPWLTMAGASFAAAETCLPRADDGLIRKSIPEGHPWSSQLGTSRRVGPWDLPEGRESLGSSIPPGQSVTEVGGRAGSKSLLSETDSSHLIRPTIRIACAIEAILVDQAGFPLRGGLKHGRRCAGTG